MAEQPLLSIAISCYTNERLNDILELLDSVKVQSYPRIETVVVVEKSTELLDRIRQYADEKRIQVKTVFNRGEQGLSAARNLGIKEASGDIIAFVDDDAILLPHWADEMIKSYEDTSVIGVTGSITPLWKDEQVDWFPSEFDWILGATGFSDMKGIKDVRNVFGANMSFRKEAFSSSGTFLTYLGAKGGGATGKHELVGEETELSIRVRKTTGKRLVFNPGVGIMHKAYRFRINPSFISKRAYWEGYTKALFNQRFNGSKRDEKVLSVEFNLFCRIITKLFPLIILGFFKNPANAYRKLSVSTIAISSVATGYFSYKLHNLFSHNKSII